MCGFWSSLVTSVCAGGLPQMPANSARSALYAAEQRRAVAGQRERAEVGTGPGQLVEGRVDEPERRLLALLRLDMVPLVKGGKEPIDDKPTALPGSAPGARRTGR